jgi:hypothetical protein
MAQKIAADKGYTEDLAAELQKSVPSSEEDLLKLLGASIPEASVRSNARACTDT